MKGYLSGQISNLTEDEFRANFKLAGELAKQSYAIEPVNPLEVEACSDPSCGDGKRLGNGEQMHHYGCYMKYDIKALLECDVIIMLPNWKNSTGAKFEWQVAMMCDIPVWFISDDYKEIRNA